MEKYKARVRKLANASSGELIPNGGIDHAETLIENIFSHANDIVRVFSGNLNARVYGSDVVVENAVEFLQSDPTNKLEILLQDVDNLSELRGHKLVDACQKVDSERCAIRKASSQDKEKGYHYVVMDNKGYRVEPDKKEPAGFGCFNDEKLATELANDFDQMFEHAESYKQ